MSHLQYSCVIMSKIGLFHVTNTEDLFSLQTIRKWHKSQWAQTKISKDDSVTSPEASRIMSCGITVSPYDNGLPGLGIQLDSSDSDCTAAHSTLFFSHQQQFLKRKWFSQIHAVHVTCKEEHNCDLKTKWVTVLYPLPNNRHSCHGNYRADKKVLDDLRSS